MVTGIAQHHKLVLVHMEAATTARPVHTRQGVCVTCVYHRAVQGHLPMMMWTRIESFVRKTITVDLQDRQTDRRTERDRGINKTTYDRHNINYWQFVRIASSTTLPYPAGGGSVQTHTRTV